MGKTKEAVVKPVSSDAKKKLRPSKVKSLAKFEAKKKNKTAGEIKKKPKQNLLSGTATWKVVYKSGTWRFIHRPTETKLLAKAKAEGKPIESPVSITLYIISKIMVLIFILYFLEKEEVYCC